MLGGKGSPSLVCDSTTGLLYLFPISKQYYQMQKEQQTPSFVVGAADTLLPTIKVLLPSEADSLLPAEAVGEFKEKGKTVLPNQTFLSPKESKKYTIERNCVLQFSNGVQDLSYYLGLASALLASAYSFNLKTIDPPAPITVFLSPSTKDVQRIISLANALVRSVILANGRGDHFGSPAYFVQRSKQLSRQLGLEVKILSGDELLKEGLRLFHAVGRASSKPPALINLAYQGNSSSNQWLALVGKGVCFDSGGLDLKGAKYLNPMFLDKSGACSCLSAIEHIAREKLPINVTATIGMVQNFIGARSYRPSDIITSKKGLTVEIADTDAEGRLVLADCMTWTQQNYKVTRLIELSTLTYSVIVGLGHSLSGIFGNSIQFSKLLQSAGEQVLERGWIMPLEEQHQEFLQSKGADLLSDANDTCPGASIAAAFLQNFVEEGVEWIHLDVAGTCINLQENRGTGYGARLLVQLARLLASKS